MMFLLRHMLAIETINDRHNENRSYIGAFIY